MTPIETALALARRGWPVFPCLTENKRPAIRGGRGFLDASRDPAVIADLWSRAGPNAGLCGVPTGAASGIDVLDLDLGKHPLVRDWLAENMARMPLTRRYSTRSGGEHWMFQAHSGLRNSQGTVIVPGIDTRASGGYIIGWWAFGCPVITHAPPAPWPPWLLALFLPKPVERKPEPAMAMSGDRAERYAQAALMNAAQRVAGAANGCRNGLLNAQTYGLARFVRDGQLSAATVTQYMAAAGVMAGLSEREVTATIQSALGAGGAQ